MVTQGRFPRALNQGCGCCLVLPPFQDGHARKLSNQVLSSSRQIFCPFFQGALLFTAVSVSISLGCYESFLPVAVLSYPNSIICSFHILIKTI